MDPMGGWATVAVSVAAVEIKIAVIAVFLADTAQLMVQRSSLGPKWIVYHKKLDFDWVVCSL